MINLEQYETKALWCINSHLRNTTEDFNPLFVRDLLSFLDERDSCQHEEYMIVDGRDGSFKVQLREYVEIPCRFSNDNSHMKPWGIGEQR